MFYELPLGQGFEQPRCQAESSAGTGGSQEEFAAVHHGFTDSDGAFQGSLMMESRMLPTLRP